MSFLDYFRRSPGGERAQEMPPNLMPQHHFFGPGIHNQPDPRALLRENLGVSDMATRAIANRVSMLDLLVKTQRRVANGTTQDETLDDHPLKALLDRPNPTHSKTQLLRLTTQYLVTVGDAAWLKVGNALGVPAELYVMPPQMYEPLVSQGRVDSYLFTDANGKRIEYPAEDVCRFFFPDPENPYKGEGYLGPNAIAVDASKFAHEHIRSHFQNDATPRVVLKPNPEAVQPTPKEWRAFLDEWRQNNNARSGKNSGLPTKIPSHWDIEQLTRDGGSDLAPLLEFYQQQQLMNMGTPASVLGRVVSGDRSSAETNQYVFDLHTVSVFTSLIADTLSYSLAPDFDDAIFVAFEDFVSGDKEFELKREESDLRNKVRSVNKVLSDRDDDPVPWGDLPIGTLADQVFDGSVPMELTTDDPEALRGSREAKPSANTRAHEAAAWARLLHTEKRFARKFERTVRSIIEAQRKETLRRLDVLTPRSRATASDLFDPDEWLGLFRERVVPLLRSVFEFVGEDSLSELVPDAEFVFNEQVVRNLEREAERLAKRTGDTTRSRIAALIADAQGEGESGSQMASRINRAFGIRRRDAITIARTEVLKANQSAQLEAFSQSGVVERKQWNSSRDSSVRDSHMIDGQIVGLNESFTLDDGEQARSPGDPNLSASNIINCRCFVTPVLEG